MEGVNLFRVHCKHYAIITRNPLLLLLYANSKIKKSEHQWLMPGRLRWGGLQFKASLDRKLVRCPSQ
jgi:hypothetical protein